MLIEATDEELMQRSAAGDRSAFDALASRYVLRLRRAALRVLADPDRGRGCGAGRSPARLDAGHDL